LPGSGIRGWPHEIAHVTERHVAERLGTTHGVQALAGAALAGNSGAVTRSRARELGAPAWLPAEVFA